MFAVGAALSQPTYCILTCAGAVTISMPKEKFRIELPTGCHQAQILDASVSVPFVKLRPYVGLKLALFPHYSTEAHLQELHTIRNSMKSIRWESDKLQNDVRQDHRISHRAAAEVRRRKDSAPVSWPHTNPVVNMFSVRCELDA
jgi:hypothetical protein